MEEHDLQMLGLRRQPLINSVRKSRVVCGDGL